MENAYKYLQKRKSVVSASSFEAPGRFNEIICVKKCLSVSFFYLDLKRCLIANFPAVFVLCYACNTTSFFYFFIFLLFSMIPSNCYSWDNGFFASEISSHNLVSVSESQMWSHQKLLLFEINQT